MRSDCRLRYHLGMCLSTSSILSYSCSLALHSLSHSSLTYRVRRSIYTRRSFYYSTWIDSCRYCCRRWFSMVSCWIVVVRSENLREFSERRLVMDLLMFYFMMESTLVRSRCSNYKDWVNFWIYSFLIDKAADASSLVLLNSLLSCPTCFLSSALAVLASSIFFS